MIEKLGEILPEVEGEYKYYRNWVFIKSGVYRKAEIIELFKNAEDRKSAIVEVDMYFSLPVRYFLNSKFDGYIKYMNIIARNFSTGYRLYLELQRMKWIFGEKWVDCILEDNVKTELLSDEEIEAYNTYKLVESI